MNYNSHKSKKRKFNLSIFLICLMFAGLIWISLFFEKDISYLCRLDVDTSVLNNEQLEVHFVNVGQGTAVLVNLPNGKTMLVDSGTKEYKTQLIKYIDNIFFKDRKKHFDYVVLSHSDDDHCDNMETILDTYEIGVFYRPNISSDSSTYNGMLIKLNSLKNNGKLEIIKNTAGLTIMDGTTTFVTWLTPNCLTYETDNDYSPIMVLEYMGKRIMLTGDATSAYGEIEAINSTYLTDIDVDVLCVGHHGSNGSTSNVFLENVLPEYIVIPVGKNSYGHPSVKMIERLASYDLEYDKNTATTYQTTLNDGNIIFYVKNDASLENFNIKNIDDYFFIDLYVILIGLDIVIISYGLCPKKTKKVIKKASKKVKNFN